MGTDAKYINPFLEAAMDVFSEMAGIEVHRGYLSKKNRMEDSLGVSIIVGICGFLTGQVVYSLNRSLAERIVEHMLPGKSAPARRALFTDTLGELANVITGRATTLLNRRSDAILQVTTPAIAIGDHLQVDLVPKSALILGLHTRHGFLEIAVAVQEQGSLGPTELAELVLQG